MKGESEMWLFGLIVGSFVIIWMFWVFLFLVRESISAKTYLIGALLFALSVFIFALTAFAAENSAPAEKSVAVKNYISCPTEFNPDDLGWAMHEIKSVEKKIDDDIIVTEHKRVFSYFPDPEQRIFVGIKKWGNPDCVAELFSYGSISGIKQKRVWAVIRSAEATAVFLLTEKGWEKGGKDKPDAFADCGANGCNLVFALYRDKVQVASRALPVEPVKRSFHFWQQEPVE